MTAQQTEPAAGAIPPGQLAFRGVGGKKHYPGVKALGGGDLEG